MKATIESEIARLKAGVYLVDDIHSAARMYENILNAPLDEQFQFDLDYINEQAEYIPKKSYWGKYEIKNT